MVTLKRYDFSAKALSEVSFDEAIFGDRTRLRCLRAASLMYAANQRLGTADTKERSEIAGTTKKPWKQKHTGRARAGSKKSPLWRGGGTIFGPQPRDYSYRRPQTELRVALRGALFGKVSDGELALVSKLSLNEPSSKAARAMFRAFGEEVGDRSSCLVVLGAQSPQAWLSMRNFPRVSVRTVDDFNADDVLRHRLVLMAEEAMDRLKTGHRGIALQGATESAKGGDAKKTAKKSADKKTAAPKASTATKKASKTTAGASAK